MLGDAAGGEGLRCLRWVCRLPEEGYPLSVLRNCMAWSKAEHGRVFLDRIATVLVRALPARLCSVSLEARMIQLVMEDWKVRRQGEKRILFRMGNMQTAQRQGGSACHNVVKKEARWRLGLGDRWRLGSGSYTQGSLSTWTTCRCSG